VALGQLDRAERLTALLSTMGERFDRPPTSAAAARCRAVLLAARGDLAVAEDALQSALRHLDRAPLPFEIARTLLLLGQVQRRRKRKTEARASLDRCIGIWRHLEARIWLQRAEAELARLGARRAPDELSATERRVA